VPDPVPSFGKYLSRERELRALTREDVARATRLSAGAIASLEEDRFEALPAEAFTLGYIRSYATCIGLDPDDAVLRYQEARQEAAAIAAPPAAPPPEPRSWVPPVVLGVLALVAIALEALHLMGH
jgi:cytoskeletal protein RodZ